MAKIYRSSYVALVGVAIAAVSLTACSSSTTSQSSLSNTSSQSTSGAASVPKDFPFPIYAGATDISYELSGGYLPVLWFHTPDSVEQVSTFYQSQCSAVSESQVSRNLRDFRSWFYSPAELISSPRAQCCSGHLLTPKPSYTRCGDAVV